MEAIIFIREPWRTISQILLKLEPGVFSTNVHCQRALPKQNSRSTSFEDEALCAAPINTNGHIDSVRDPHHGGLALLGEFSDQTRVRGCPHQAYAR